MSAEPVLLPGGQVLLAGKSPTAYLLNGAHLGGVGGQQALLPSVCSTNIDGGVAVTGSTVYLPCVSGIVAVRAATSPPGLRLLWRSGTGGGPPIAAGGLVWTISQAGTLYGLDPQTGQVRQQAAIGTVANHFPTPSVGAGLLLAPAANRVVAFRAAGGPGTPASQASPAPASTRPRGAGQRAGAGGRPGPGGRGPVRRSHRGHRGRRGGAARRGGLAAVAAGAAPRLMIYPGPLHDHGRQSRAACRQSRSKVACSEGAPDHGGRR